MDDREAVEKYFEKTMPTPVVQPLFDEAKKLGIGFYLGYARMTPEGRRFTPPSWWTRTPTSWSSIGRSISRTCRSQGRWPRSSISRRSSSRSATWDSASGPCSVPNRHVSVPTTPLARNLNRVHVTAKVPNWWCSDSTRRAGTSTGAGATHLRMFHIHHAPGQCLTEDLWIARGRQVRI